MLRIPKNGVVAIGKKELEAHLRGEKLTYRQQVLANCYQCMNRYLDGRRDCEIKSYCAVLGLTDIPTKKS